jgi:hypothetical protein
MTKHLRVPINTEGVIPLLLQDYMERRGFKSQAEAIRYLIIEGTCADRDRANLDQLPALDDHYTEYQAARAGVNLPEIGPRDGLNRFSLFIEEREMNKWGGNRRSLTED